MHAFARSLVASGTDRSTMAKSDGTVIFLVILLMAAAFRYETMARMTCGMVYHAVSPCLGYLTNKHGLRLRCCEGLTLLYSAARSGRDRRMACRCLKNAASRMRNINYQRASHLQGACGIQIPYKISPRTDCSRSLEYILDISLSISFSHICYFFTRTQLRMHACMCMCVFFCCRV